MADTKKKTPDNLTHEQSAATRESFASEEIDTEGITVQQALKVLFFDNPPHIMRAYPYESYYPTPTDENHLCGLGLDWGDGEMWFEWNEESCEVSAYMFKEDRPKVGDADYSADKLDQAFSLWFQQNAPFWDGICPPNPAYSKYR